MLPPVDIAVIGGQMLASYQAGLEHCRFITKQFDEYKYVPTRSEYFLAIAMTWDVNNPPPPPYFKTKLALLINAITNLLPESK